jgi:adenosylmethionine-8-amino-7-oxononanoate aminotransferase
MNDAAREVIFVTGTGTGVGKTIVAGALAAGLARRNLNVSYWKPVQCGALETGGDTKVVADLALGADVKTLKPAFSFAAPASPDQAAPSERAAAATCAALLQQGAALSKEGFLIAEGAGGVHVPLNKTPENWLDFLELAEWPCLVVAASGLGTLNHTSLTIEALRNRGIAIVAVVLSGERHEANEKSLARLIPGVPLIAFETVSDLQHAPEWPTACEKLATDVLAAYEHVTPNARNETALLQTDKNHVWHPYTQHENAAAPLVIKRAKGVWLETAAGKRLLDGTSSWWVNNIGHGRREIAQAMIAQQNRLDHVIFAGATHEGAVELAKDLVELAGAPFSRVFYSDNGSTAVEVALKIAFQSWVNRGDKRRDTFLTFRGSYHGDTFGTMSAAAAEQFHGVFKPLLFKTHVATPVTMHASELCPRGVADFAAKQAELEGIFTNHNQAIAAVIIEPLVQGVGGMLMQDPRWLKELARLCLRYEIPLIFDEVFTGFGRVGASFAFQRAGVIPDIICVAKGLTGGTLPLSATICREQFFRDFLSTDKSKALLHGHSYTANPIGCAVARAALKIFVKEDLAARALALEKVFFDWLAGEGRRRNVLNPRALGGILAFEIPGSADQNDYFHKAGPRLQQLAFEKGLMIRPLGNTFYFLPPLSISNDELKFSLKVIGEILEN